jgi:hypothetical protein
MKRAAMLQYGTFLQPRSFRLRKKFVCNKTFTISKKIRPIEKSSYAATKIISP